MIYVIINLKLTHANNYLFYFNKLHNKTNEESIYYIYSFFNYRLRK